MPDTVVITEQETSRQEEVQQPRLWNVVLLDDDHHTYEYVIRLVQKVFHRTVEDGFRIACAVDNDGRAVCATIMREHAEFKQELIHGFGPDPIMAQSVGSMTAILEPADFGGEDDDDA